MKWSLVFTFFRSLNLAHLERSLYSISKQTLKPDEYIFFDNNTLYSPDEIRGVITKHFDLSQWRIYFEKHGDPRKTTASWGQNTAIRLAAHQPFVLCKADCIYDFRFSEELVSLFAEKSSNGYHVLQFTSCHFLQMHYWTDPDAPPYANIDHAADLEPLGWREDTQRLLANNHRAAMQTTGTDCPSFCTSKMAMELAGWYDEELISWGFWQPDLQRAMQSKGIQFYHIPKCLYFHMEHEIENGPRNVPQALAEYGASSRRRG